MGIDDRGRGRAARACVISLVISLAISLAIATPCLADSATALAQALFDEGHAALVKGEYATACPKLEESQRLEPKNGTLLNLATCHAGEGKTARAWAEFKEGLAQAVRENTPQNAQYAKDQLAALEPKLSKVTITSATSGAASVGLEVTIDGATIGPGALGAALPVDPGAHTLRASQPGHATWSTTVDVPPGPWSKTIEIPALTATSNSTAGMGTSTSTGTGETKTTNDVAPSTSRMTPLVWTLGGVAIVGAGVGTIFGLRAISKNKDAEAKCPNGACVDDGLDLDHQARTSATISTLGFGVGAAAAIGAVIVFVTHDDDAAPVSVGVAPNGIAVFGAF